MHHHRPQNLHIDLVPCVTAKHEEEVATSSCQFNPLNPSFASLCPVSWLMIRSTTAHKPYRVTKAKTDQRGPDDHQSPSFASGRATPGGWAHRGTDAGKVKASVEEGHGKQVNK